MFLFAIFLDSLDQTAFLPWRMRKEGFESEPPSLPLAATHSEKQENQGREARIYPSDIVMVSLQSYREAPSHLD